MKYLILGNGFIGNKFKNYLDNDAVLSNRRINSIKDVYLELVEHKPEIIINGIGKTGRPNIDWCESNKETTFFSNVTIPTLLAEVCEDTGIYLVHMGSGCIFEGDNEGKGWSEDDKPNFFGSFYSRTKIYSEQILKEYKNVLQLRIRMPIDNKPHDRNLITKLLKYNEVIGDIPNSITYLPDLMKAVKRLTNNKKTGIYNVVQHGAITHRELLTMYKDIVDPSYKLPEFISVDRLKGITKAERSNCILNTVKLIGKGTGMRNVRNAVRDCLQEYRKWV